MVLTRGTAIIVKLVLIDGPTFRPISGCIFMEVAKIGMVFSGLCLYCMEGLFAGVGLKGTYDKLQK